MIQKWINFFKLVNFWWQISVKVRQKMQNNERAWNPYRKTMFYGIG